MNDRFNIGIDTLECVKQYKYLGLIIENTGKFNEARKQLFQKGMKANFKLYRDMKSADPSIKTILHIFDHCIKAIVPYGCENWGVFNITQKRKTLPMFDIFKEWEMEKLNLKYCKHILGVTKLCTNIAVLSELGRNLLYIDLLKQLCMYWYRLEHSPYDLLSRAYTEYKSSNN